MVLSHPPGTQGTNQWSPTQITPYVGSCKKPLPHSLVNKECLNTKPIKNMFTLLVSISIDIVFNLQQSSCHYICPSLLS